jgi:hypothetical protein
MFTILKKTAAVVLLAGFTFSSSSLANGYASYHVTITNLTNSIIFTPILVASQRRAVPIYELGSPAGEDLAAIAEAGDIGPLTSTLHGNHRVVDVQNSGGPLLPGKSVTVVVSAAQGARRISIVAMMLPTNDGFIALDSVRVPRHGSATFFSPGFDAGSEQNDELCTNIPGPVCNGVGPSPGENDGDEGYVHIHRGMHGIGDLAADVYDWRNPVARITVTRVSGY